jgi:3-hydroxyacyl-[acyl-carrier-protein] dehydratase
MVDRVTGYEKGGWLQAFKNITMNEIFQPGHFPSGPIYPGALILEGLGQCSLVLFQLTHGRLVGDEIGVLGSVQGRFLRPVYPGDRLEYEVKSIKMTSVSGIFSGEARVEDQLVARCELTMGKTRRGVPPTPGAGNP